MKKSIVIISMALCLMFIAGSVFAADDFRRQFRRQADSNYRIAKRDYRKAVKDYGESLEAMPDEERTKLCTQIRRGIHDNNTQITLEAVTEEQRFKRRIAEMKEYQKAANCPPKN